MSTYIDLNLKNMNFFPSNPILSCRKNTGPCEVSLISIAMPKKIGEKKTNTKRLQKISIVRFIKRASFFLSILARTSGYIFVCSFSSENTFSNFPGNTCHVTAICPNSFVSSSVSKARMHLSTSSFCKGFGLFSFAVISVNVTPIISPYLYQPLMSVSLVTDCSTSPIFFATACFSNSSST